MKNILFIHGSSELYGASKVLYYIIEGLDKDKFKPIVLLPYEGELGQQFRELGAEVFISPIVVLRRQNANLSGFISLLCDIVKSVVSIRKIDKNFKLDLVYSNTSPVLSGAIYAKLFRKKHLWHVHEITTKPAFFRYFMPRLINSFSDKIVVISNATKVYVSTCIHKESKIKVVYNGIKGFQSGQNTGSNLKDNIIRVGMIGRINAWKGQEVFVKAAHKILEQNSNFQFLIVGDCYKGEDFFLNNLKKMIAEFNLEEDVQIVGFVEDISSIYQALDIVVVPSTQPEPFGLVAIESMSMGKPVIASNIGAIPEIVVDGDTGILFEAKNEVHLQKAVLELAANSELRKKMGQSGLQRQQKYFNEKRFCNEINEVISACIMDNS